MRCHPKQVNFFLNHRFLIIIGGRKRSDKDQEIEETKNLEIDAEGESDSEKLEYDYYQYPIWAFDLMTLHWNEIIPENHESFTPRSFHMSCHGMFNL